MEIATRKNPGPFLKKNAPPLMLRYGGEKGRGWKQFFCVYCPARTALLFLLARRLG
ncbi:hypothetical protein [Oscillibacter sp.]|uniref:hypothetical protein n=1 Tax=Oscillibacter sp. TaxID=1945593 RepID=UPI002D801A30|nr:hypothetical protein [Oscillibacter sp.]